jgi:hypothetical protein
MKGDHVRLCVAISGKGTFASRSTPLFLRPPINFTSIRSVGSSHLYIHILTVLSITHFSCLYSYNLRLPSATPIPTANLANIACLSKGSFYIRLFLSQSEFFVALAANNLCQAVGSPMQPHRKGTRLNEDEMTYE